MKSIKEFNESIFFCFTRLNVWVLLSLEIFAVDIKYISESEVSFPRYKKFPMIAMVDPGGHVYIIFIEILYISIGFAFILKFI